MLTRLKPQQASKQLEPRPDIYHRSLDKLKRIKTNMEFIQEGKHNQLALAFWTCLQLER